MSCKLENSKFFSSTFSLEFAFSIGNSCSEKANHLRMKFTPLQQANTRSAHSKSASPLLLTCFQ